MSTGLIYDNLVAYSLQIGLLVGLAAFVPVVLRLRQPGGKLIYWQILLAACLLLPLQPWKQALIPATVAAPAVIQAVPAMPVHAAPAPSMPRSEMVLLVLLSGCLVRLGWLAVGFWKLRRYRRHARPLEPAPTWSVEAWLGVSDEIASPVTFGWRRPVVLLPANFQDMDTRMQEAILCHEVMHVRRGDWLFTVAEELVRTVFWFHPAIWWLLGEIGLAREQEVDRLAIEITNEREEYMDALLAIAGARPQLDLAPAPLFLRKRHLKHRVVMILREARMSKTHLISTLAAGCGALAAACWLVMGAFPLTAQPQVAPQVIDAPGVTVNLNGASVLHRTSVPYPLALREQGVQGPLSVEVRLDSVGNVSDARVLSGPDELRKTVLQSVLQWHFTHDVAGTTRTVQIAFEVPKPGVTTEVVPGGVVRGVVGGVPGGVQQGVPGVLGGIIGSVPTAAPPPPPPPSNMAQAREFQVMKAPAMPTRISSIRVAGLPEQSRNELMASLPVHEGDEWTPDLQQRVTQAAKAYDEHLSVQRTFTQTANGLEMTLLIAAPGNMAMPTPAMAPAAPPTPPAGTLVVGGAEQGAKIIRKVPPTYPELAKSARVSGVVHLAAIIAKDGTIQELHSLGGPALLIQAAMDAVKNWVYQPTLLNGAPVPVQTTIDVNFTLNE